MFKDILYVVTDYSEQPRKGIADFNGVPHYFVSLYDNEANNYSDVYMLFAIDEHLFDLTLLAWAIQRRFIVSKTGEDIPFHRIGALPTEKNRYNNVIAHIQSKVVIEPRVAKYAFAKFFILEPKENYNLAFVNWTLLPKTDDLKVFFDKSLWRVKKERANYSFATEGDFF